jgi:hypothetical protein
MSSSRTQRTILSGRAIRSIQPKGYFLQGEVKSLTGGKCVQRKPAKLENWFALEPDPVKFGGRP